MSENDTKLGPLLIGNGAWTSTLAAAGEFSLSESEFDYKLDCQDPTCEDSGACSIAMSAGCMIPETESDCKLEESETDFKTETIWLGKPLKISN